MEYLKNKPFSSKPATGDYRDNFDAVFGKRGEADAETQPELPPSDSTRQLPLPLPTVFFGPQPDGTYTMEWNNGGLTIFRVYAGNIYRLQPDHDEEMLDTWAVLVYADNARWRAWAMAWAMDSLLTRNRFGNGR